MIDEAGRSRSLGRLRETLAAHKVWTVIAIVAAIALVQLIVMGVGF